MLTFRFNGIGGGGARWVLLLRGSVRTPALSSDERGGFGGGGGIDFGRSAAIPGKGGAGELFGLKSHKVTHTLSFP